MPPAPADDDAPLDDMTRRSLPALFLGVGAFYLALAAAAPFLPGRPTPVLHALWAVSAVLGVAGSAVLRLRPAPAGWGNHLAGMFGMAVLVDSLRLVAEAGPAFLYAIVITLAAFALVLLSLPWMAGLCAFALGGWLGLAWLAGGGPEWSPRTVSLLAVCVLALVVQATRIGLHRRLHQMQARDAEREAQRHELERTRLLNEQRRRIVRLTAHELATPLTPVLLQLHLLAQSDLPPEARKRLASLERNLERLRATVGRVVAAAQADEATELLYGAEGEGGGMVAGPTPASRAAT